MHATIGRVYRAQKYAGDRREASLLWWRTVGVMVTFTLSMLVGSLAVTAQPPAKIPRIGMLLGGSPDWTAPVWRPSGTGCASWAM